MKILPSLVIIFIFIFFKSNAQESFPFPRQNAIWSELQLADFTAELFTVHYGIEGDTLINERTYKKIFTSTDTVYDASNTAGLSYFGGVRVENGKAFFIPRFDILFTEYLIYDSNFNVNDTLFDGGIELSTIGTVVVESIDSVTLDDGSKRKRWNFEYIISSIDTTDNRDEIERGFAFSWIEGIGNTKCPFKEPVRCAFFTSPDNRLLCFEESNQKIYRDPEFLDCYFSTIVSNDEPFPSSTLNIFPNPTQGVVVLQKSQNTPRIISIKIIDLGGKVLLREKVNFDESHQLDISHLPSGLYFILFDNGFFTFRQKLIKI